MNRKELAKKVSEWFENELMQNSEIELRDLTNPDEILDKDFERRGEIVNFSLELERKVSKELEGGILLSLRYREDEENNLLKEVSELSGIDTKWLPNAYVVVSEGTGMSVYR